MKGITTIASLPSGAGQAAQLKPEVGEAKPNHPIILTGSEAMALMEKMWADALASLPVISPDMLDTSA